MELTIESAISPGGLVGHFAYLLLVVSMMMRVMWILRVFVIASSFVAISYCVIWLKDPVGVFWESLLVLVNIVQLTITYFTNKRSRFDEEEAGFVHTCFPGLSNSLKRRLIDLGDWIDNNPGVELIKEGEPVSHLIYLADGQIKVASNGRTVGYCESGSFIGEMTVLTSSPATASAFISKPARYWSVNAADLRKLISSHEEIEQAVQACFQRNLLAKLVASNRYIENSGGLESLIASSRNG